MKCSYILCLLFTSLFLPVSMAGGVSISNQKVLAPQNGDDEVLAWAASADGIHLGVVKRTPSKDGDVLDIVLKRIEVQSGRETEYTLASMRTKLSHVPPSLVPALATNDSGATAAIIQRDSGAIDIVVVDALGGLKKIGMASDRRHRLILSAIVAAPNKQFLVLGQQSSRPVAIMVNMGGAVAWQHDYETHGIGLFTDAVIQNDGSIVFSCLENLKGMMTTYLIATNATGGNQKKIKVDDVMPMCPPQAVKVCAVADRIACVYPVSRDSSVVCKASLYDSDMAKKAECIVSGLPPFMGAVGCTSMGNQFLVATMPLGKLVITPVGKDGTVYAQKSVERTGGKQRFLRPITEVHGKKQVRYLVSVESNGIVTGDVSVDEAQK